MSTLAEHAARYVAMRRLLGYQMTQPARALAGLVCFAEQAGHEHLSVQTVLEWAEPATTPGAYARQLSLARRFSRYLIVFDPDSEILPTRLSSVGQVRRVPYVYSPSEVTALMSAAHGLLRGDLWPSSVATLVGLCAATGIRPGEAYRLSVGDVDLPGAALAVLRSKGGRSRLLPLHPSTVRALGHYVGLRAVQHLGHDRLFVTASGRPICSSGFSCTFRALRPGRHRGRPGGQPGPPWGPAPQLRCVHPGRLAPLGCRRRPAPARLERLFGTCPPGQYLLVLAGSPRADGACRREARRRLGGRAVTALAPVVQGFFTQRLAQRRASPATVAAYRDALRLLLRFVSERAGKAPSALEVSDLGAEAVGAFLDHLETARENSVRSRNLRLTAVHSLFKYAALACPQDAETIRRVLAIPTKRATTTIVSYLTRPETEALLAVPDRNSELGRRDHALILVGVQTGLRVSELTAAVWSDITFGAGANIYTRGKGRKERCTPLLPATARLLQGWARQRHVAPDDAVFRARAGGHLSTDAVKDLLSKYVAVAAVTCPTLVAKRVTPHTLRHTCAMNLLQSGVDIATIALWLGHSSTQATQIYLHADLRLKEQALALTAPNPAARARYKPSDSLLAYLESL